MCSSFRNISADVLNLIDIKIYLTLPGFFWQASYVFARVTARSLFFPIQNKTYIFKDDQLQMQFKDQGPSNTKLFAVSPESLYSTDEASNIDLSNFFCL